MTSILKMVGVVLVVGVLCVGVVALATDFIWDGNTADTSWLTATNWDQDSSHPQNANDNATIDAAGNLCTFDAGSDVTINDLTLAGLSPTKRKLHIKDAALTVHDLDLDDYAELDLDRFLTVNGKTSMSGSVWATITGVLLCTGDLTIDGANTVLDLTTVSGGGVEVEDLVIDAETADAPRSFTLNGGSLSFVPVQALRLISDDDADNRRAKFWFASGTVTFANFASINITGGSTPLRRAEMDLDEDLQVGAGGATGMTGHVAIDIAANKTFDTRILALEGPCVLKVTTASGGELVSS